MAEQLQVSYDDLADIAQRLARQAELIEEVHQSIATSVDKLDGNWIGRGAQAFFDETRAETLPSTQRLAEVFRAGEGLIQNIITNFRASEEEAAQNISIESSSSQVFP
ncbi:MAG: WXG100 family type VII secretion target [Anaerolineales bacterium]|nr:WXG100 family type VII secretion target [Anaerolineales bacterium]